MSLFSSPNPGPEPFACSETRDLLKIRARGEERRAAVVKRREQARLAQTALAPLAAQSSDSPEAEARYLEAITRARDAKVLMTVAGDPSRAYQEAVHTPDAWLLLTRGFERRERELRERLISARADLGERYKELTIRGVPAGLFWSDETGAAQRLLARVASIENQLDIALRNASRCRANPAPTPDLNFDLLLSQLVLALP